MKQPLIGLTTPGRTSENEFRIPSAYVDSVRRAGGIPVLIPPGETNLNLLLETLQGFVFTGGGDLKPQWYGGVDHESLYGIDQERDIMENQLIQLVMASPKPILAICRGMQFINVILGGTLIEDLDSAPPGNISHRHPDRLPVIHDVVVTPGSHLASVLKETNIQCSSLHHQAIRLLSPELKIAAQAPDGLIEAFEWKKKPNLVAVQWHPEITAKTDPVQQRLFDNLVKEASHR